MSDNKLPEDGRKVMWRKKGDVEWKFGVVDFVWIAMDEHAIKINAGKSVDIFPAFGDEWSYL